MYERDLVGWQGGLFSSGDEMKGTAAAVVQPSLDSCELVSWPVPLVCRLSDSGKYGKWGWGLGLVILGKFCFWLVWQGIGGFFRGGHSDLHKPSMR